MLLNNMANIPVQFRKSSEAAIASYSYTDLAEGTGVVTYQGFSTKEDTTTDYHLGITIVHSADIEKELGSSSGTSFTAGTEIDFDLAQFNLPKSIEGTALIQIPTYCYTTSGGSGTFTGYIQVKLRKWDGSTETEIANTRTPDISCAAGGTNNHKVNLMPLTIPKTHFKKGEILRISITGWSKWSAALNGHIGMGCDPLNRDGTYIVPSVDTDMTTQFTNYIPFKIDL